MQHRKDVAIGQHNLKKLFLQAIAAATGQNAKLQHLQDRGTIAAGKRADLLVLDANPLAEIHNTREIVAVYHDGRSIRDLPGK